MFLRPLGWVGVSIVSVLAASGCDQKKEPAKVEEKAAAVKPAEPVAPAAPALKTDKGVDVEAKTIKIGALNDESGPAAAIGVPYALGKRILAEEVNAGGSGLLPEGWKVQLVEKDHGYDPAKSQEAFESIKNDVLYFATSFGTPPTLPLRPFLEKDLIVAYPASLSSQMAEFAFTPPAGPSYVIEAMRAADWVAEKADKSKVKAGILYDQTDYGADGLAGWKKGTAAHGMTIAVERAVKPGQKDFTAEISELKKAGVTHVFLAILPSSTGPVLGTAAKLTFGPTWIGATPSWIDAFFAHPKLPAAVFANFYLATGLPYWAEPVPGMDKFLAAFEKHGKALNARPDSYLLMSYLQGRIGLEVARRAIEAGDITRAGYSASLKSLKGFEAGGLLQPLDFSSLPYVTSTKARILAPDFAKTTWRVESPYATPSAEGK